MNYLATGKIASDLTSKEEAPSLGDPGLRLPRHTRKLFDKVLLSFHHACDVGDLEVADRLLPILEVMTTRRQGAEDTGRRRNIEGLVAAHERLWHLRHPEMR